MSCEADRKAIATAQAPTASTEAFGSSVAMTKHSAASPSCVSSSQLRRRPGSIGGSKRSASGAQTNLKV